MESKIVYFEKKGAGNTDEVLGLVSERLKKSDVRTIVLASTTGSTARKAMEWFKSSGIRLIVVPHQHGFPNGSPECRFPQELVREIRNAGHEVHFGTMLFHTDKLFESRQPQAVANFLRSFSEGYKVCYEIVLMASDAGHLAAGEKVIAVAGTGLGADTALVMQAATTQDLRRLKVQEILCKPLHETE